MNKLTITEAELLASKFRSQCGLGPAEPVNAKSLLRQLGITAIYRPLSEKSFGISCKSNDRRFILINSNSARGRQHFTIAHELFHLYFDENPKPHMCGGQVCVEEKNADLFASVLLMPRDGLNTLLSNEDIITHKVSLATVLRMEQLFQVSRLSLLIRLKGMGLISEKQLESLNTSVKESAREYGYDCSLYEPGNHGLMIGTFGEKARALFERRIISEGHYHELLNMISDGREEN